MIRYELITRERYIAVADFLVNDFFVNEPFGLALGESLSSNCLCIYERKSSSLIKFE